MPEQLRSQRRTGMCGICERGKTIWHHFQPVIRAPVQLCDTADDGSGFLYSKKVLNRVIIVVSNN